MNLIQLSKEMLKDAITKGYIKLPEGDLKELNTSQVLAVAKYILKEGINLETEEEAATPSNTPLEMFSKPQVEPTPLYDEETRESKYKCEEESLELDLDTDSLYEGSVIEEMNRTVQLESAYREILNTSLNALVLEKFKVTNE